MRESLLELLREPDTYAELDLIDPVTRDGEIWEGLLRSRETGKDYPIVRGIPRFVPSSNYASSFGYQWNLFPKIQLDSASGAHYSRDRFDAETGWCEKTIGGQWVLDAGCGSGRFAEIAASMKANVIAMDYSNAVDAAFENLRHVPGAHFVQGDIFHPPFRPHSIPAVYSIGVIQHTPDPKAAIESILRLITPGGRFAFTIYARRWYTLLFSKYLLRPVTRRIPKRTLLLLIRAVMPIAFPVTSILFPMPIIGKLAKFLIPIANYTEKRSFTRRQRYQEAILDTFDMLSPQFDQPMTAQEVCAVFKRCGVVDFRFQTTVPINVVGATPQA